jgi:hypothetical protein
MIPSNRKVQDQIWKYLTGPQPEAELKINLSVDITDVQGGSTLWIQPLHSESNHAELQLAMPQLASVHSCAQLTWLVSSPPQDQPLIKLPAQPSPTPPQDLQIMEELHASASCDGKC